MPRLYNRIKTLDWGQKFVLDLYPPTEEQLEMIPSEFKYKLLETPRQKDPLLYFIRREIRELETDITVCTAGFQLQPLTWSPPIWPVTAKNAHRSHKIYAIKRRFEEFPYSIQISIPKRDEVKKLTLDCIMAQMHPREEPQPLKKVLLEMASSWRTSLTPLDKQKLWWPRTKQKFRFNDLPKELRSQILVDVLGSEIHPDVVRDSSPGGYRVVLGHDLLHCRLSWRARMNIREPNTAIFLVSRQVQKEALEAAWTGTIKHFSCTWLLKNVLTCPNAPTATNWLTKVRLDLYMKQYFYMFGIKALPNIVKSDENEIAESLKASPLVKELTLVFESPYTDDARIPVGHPWDSDPGQQHGHPPCWRTLIDWILTAAYPYIKDIPRVRLRGCIKTATAEKWHDILAIAYKKSQGCTAFDNDPEFDYDRAVHDMISYPAESMPPTCYCPKSCYSNMAKHRVPRGKRIKYGRYERHQELTEGFDRDDTFRQEDLDACFEDIPEGREW